MNRPYFLQDKHVVHQSYFIIFTNSFTFLQRQDALNVSVGQEEQSKKYFSAILYFLFSNKCFNISHLSKREYFQI